MSHPLKIPGLQLIETKTFHDDRGYFKEHYKKALYDCYGLPEFVQDNHSRSKPGVIRGLHYQHGEHAQGKLVSVVRGKIFDVAVDVRPGSATYGQWEAIELSDENGLQLWIPAGFAHGFCVMGDEEADVFYKVDKPYSPGNEGGIRFDDPKLNIPWPIQNPQLSPKDRSLKSISL